MTRDDALFRYRLRGFALAHELGNIRAACRAPGIHHSTYYRWLRQVQRFGLEVLRPRERRASRMPNAISVLVEQRMVAFSLGHPGHGPLRISADMAQSRWGGIRVSSNGVWRVLRRHGLNTRAKRLGLIAGYAAPGPEKREQRPERHIEASRPGELVQDGLLLHRQALWRQGRSVAVHRYRCRFGLHMGGAAHDATERRCTMGLTPRQARG